MWSAYKKMVSKTKNTFIRFLEVSKYWKTIFFGKNRPDKGLKIDVKMREN